MNDFSGMAQANACHLG